MTIQTQKKSNNASLGEMFEEYVDTYVWKHDFGKGEVEYERLDIDGTIYVYNLKTHTYLGTFNEKTNTLNKDIPDPIAPVPAVPLRRSARLAAKKAKENKLKFTINHQQTLSQTQPQTYLQAPTMDSRKNRLVKKLIMMSKQVEMDTVNKVDFKLKFLHIVDIFEFIYYNDMLRVIGTKEYEESVKIKLNEIIFSIQTKELPYWLAAKFTTVSNNLFKQIEERKTK